MVNTRLRTTLENNNSLKDNTWIQEEMENRHSPNHQLQNNTSPYSKIQCYFVLRYVSKAYDKVSLDGLKTNFTDKPTQHNEKILNQLRYN